MDAMVEAPAMDDLDPFLAALGQRIRRSRERRGISRRVLSDQCGLSQRFLAQEEYGRGNISVLRLRRLAEALDMSLDELLSENGNRSESQNPRREPEERRWPFSPAVVADLFCRAGTREQEAVLDVLVRGGSGSAA